MTHGAGFRIAGMVSRKPFVVSSGKVAFVTLAVNIDGRSKKLDLKTFDCIVEVGGLVEGQEVEVTGTVDAEQPKQKDRTPVMKDGREFWCPSLVIRAVKGAKAAPPPPPDDDNPLPDW